MAEPLHPAATPQIAARRRQLAPGINEAFDSFSSAVFAEGAALSEKPEQLIVVAVAHLSALLHQRAHQARMILAVKSLDYPKRRAYRARG